MEDIITKGMNCFEENIGGPDKYLTMYSTYYYIFNGEAEKWVKNFMAQEPLPLLKVTFFNMCMVLV